MTIDKMYMEIAANVTEWYRTNGRDLPWRCTKDPYKIWISEIMLQQTQVETVKPYYERFIQTLPNVQSLAEADIMDVYKLWEGLGYYRRASHLQEAAIMVVEQYNGHFPDTYSQLIKLKGIGMYTASAISSIAFGEAKGVVDGNTLRIVARVFNREDNIALQKTKNEFGGVMDAMIVHADPSDFNQGMMDIGAMICTPVHPSCTQCPLKNICIGFKEKTAARLPVNIKKVKKETIHLITVVIQHQERLMMVRKEEGLLRHLYGFVQYPCDTPSEFETLFYKEYGVHVHLTQYIKDVKHVFTHRTWVMHVYEASLDSDGEKLPLFKMDEIEKIPVPTAHLKVLKAYLNRKV